MEKPVSIAKTLGPVNTTGSKSPEFVYDEKRAPEECHHCGRKLRWRYYLIGNTRVWLHLEPCTCEGAVLERKRKAVEEERRRREEENRQKMRRIEELFRQSRLGKRFRERTFDNFVVTTYNRKAFEVALEYAKNFSHYQKAGEGLFITGGTGTGKTHLAAAIANYLLQNLVTVVFVNITRLLSGIKATFDESSASTEQQLVDELCRVELLVIDDLGKEKPSTWVEEKLYTIVNARYEDYKPIVITSNYSLEDIETRLENCGEAIVSRLMEMCRGLKIDGPDYRKMRAKQKGNKDVP